MRKTIQTYRANAKRLSGRAAELSDPLERAQFAALAADWERLTALAEWQERAGAVTRQAG
jgi:hypothetical protein